MTADSFNHPSSEPPAPVRSDAERCDDWESLECLYQAFPSTHAQRRAWRAASTAVRMALLTRGHLGWPALIPGLVHARLATALLAAGYRRQADLARSRFLCLGCHAGLEVRILRDFGAADAMGLEIRGEVVDEGLRSGLIRPGEVATADFWDFLTASADPSWDDILLLAPQQIALGKLWQAARGRLAPHGHLVAVAQASDLTDLPADVVDGPALEDTMRWYVLTNG